jgi:hypothetical protein
LKKIFEYYDKNKNGVIEREEFDLLSKDFLKYINKKFEMDVLKSDPNEEKIQELLGNLSKDTREEFMGKKFDLNQFKNELFENINTRGNNKIDYIEFKNWCIDRYTIENKEKGVEPQIIVPFIHFKHILDSKEQIQMLDKVRCISGEKIQKKFQNYEKLCSFDFLSNDSRSEKIEFNEEIKKITDQVGDKLDKCKNPFPKNYVCGLMEVLKFDQNEFLEGHCDYVRGYGIIVSIGKQKKKKLIFPLILIKKKRIDRKFLVQNRKYQRRDLV